MAPGPDDVTKTNFEDIKNLDVDHTINKVDLNNDEIKNVDFDTSINKIDLSDDIKNVDFDKTINKVDLSDDVKSDFDKTINKLDLNNDEIKNVIFDKTINKIDLKNDEIKNVDFDKNINKVDLKSDDIKNLDFDKKINKLDLNSDDVKNVIFDKTINKVDLNSSEIKNIEVDDTFKKADLGNGIKNVDLEKIINKVDFDSIKNTLDKDNADLSAPNAAGAPAAPPSVGAPAAPEPAAKTPSFLSRAWSQIKDAGSRAYDAISSIPDRIRAQFSSSQPPPAAQAVAPVVPAAPAAPATPALGKDGVGLEQTPQLLGVQTPAPGRAPGDHVGVRFGSDEAHLTPKGQGLQTSGILESVEHKDGVAVVHFKAGAHEQVLAVDEKSPSGKAVAEALDHIKPGDEMTMKIGHDQRRNDTIEIADKTSGFTGHVQDGKLEAGQNMPGKGQEPKLGR